MSVDALAPAAPSAPLIAVIDDDPLARASTDMLLRALGYATAAFDGGEAFLRDPRLFACIVSDVQMAGMSGPELQHRLAVERSQTPVILITGFPEDAGRDAALREGAIAYVSKTRTSQELVRAVALSLSRSDA